jgi:hypothetical protein
MISLPYTRARISTIERFSPDNFDPTIIWGIAISGDDGVSSGHDFAS